MLLTSKLKPKFTVAATPTVDPLSLNSKPVPVAVTFVSLDPSP